MRRHVPRDAAVAQHECVCLVWVGVSTACEGIFYRRTNRCCCGLELPMSYTLFTDRTFLSQCIPGQGRNMRERAHFTTAWTYTPVVSPPETTLLSPAVGLLACLLASTRARASMQSSFLLTTFSRLLLQSSTTLDPFGTPFPTDFWNSMAAVWIPTRLQAAVFRSAASTTPLMASAYGLHEHTHKRKPRPLGTRYPLTIEDHPACEKNPVPAWL